MNIDLMRVTVFTFVISAHVVTITLDEEQVPVAAWGMLMHFARYAFVFVSAFVLCHGSPVGGVSPVRFWRRRLGAVALPYLLWTVIYYSLETAMTGWPGLGPWLHLLALHVFWGTEWYHLYFLLVAIQLYLIFPALLWLIDRRPAAHGWMIAAAAVVQLGSMVLVAYTPAPPGLWGIAWEHDEIMLGMYLMFAVCGAVAARRRHQVNDWLAAHPWRLVGFGLFGLAVCGVGFVINTARSSAWTAAGATLPSVLPWAAAATVITYAIATAIVRDRGDDRITRLARVGAQRAFGVFAVHPLVLWIIDTALRAPLEQALPGQFGRTMIVFLITVAGSLLAVELLLRTPLSRPLLSRSRIRGIRPGREPRPTGWTTAT